MSKDLNLRNSADFLWILINVLQQSWGFDPFIPADYLYQNKIIVYRLSVLILRDLYGNFIHSFFCDFRNSVKNLFFKYS